MMSHTIDSERMKPAEWSRAGDKSRDSTEQLTEPNSPKRITREDVLSALGYRTSGQAKTTTSGAAALPTAGKKSDTCHRCGKKVYPLERIDIGDIYHRGCFKCLVCGIQLTLKTFSRVKDFNGDNKLKEIYCRSHQPWQGASTFGGDAVEIKTAIAAQKKASDKLIKQFEQNPVQYDGEALEFVHAREIKQQTVRRKVSVKYSDFKKLGVFDAQKELEEKHRKEEDELYQQMMDERRHLVDQLDQQLTLEREQTVHDLIAWFEQQGLSGQEREIGLHKFERIYKKEREERIKNLMDKIAVEEQGAITRLVEKHAQEMLLLIHEKEEKAGDMLEPEEPTKYAKGDAKLPERTRTYRSELIIHPSSGKQRELVRNNVKDNNEDVEAERTDDETNGDSEAAEKEETGDNEHDETIGSQSSSENTQSTDHKKLEEHRNRKDTEQDKRGDKRYENDEEEQDGEEDEEEAESSSGSLDSCGEEDIEKKYEKNRKVDVYRTNLKGDDDEEEQGESSFGSWESGDERPEGPSNNTYNYGKNQENATANVTSLKEKTDVQVERVTVVSSEDDDTRRHPSKISVRDAEMQVDDRNKSDKETQVESSHHKNKHRTSSDEKEDGTRHRNRKHGDEDDEDNAGPPHRSKKHGDANDDTSTNNRRHKNKKDDDNIKHKHHHHEDDISDSETRTGNETKSSSAGPKQASGEGHSGRKIQLTIRMEKMLPKYASEDEETDEEMPNYGNRPEICPPKCRKSKLYATADVFKDFDRRAIKEAQKDPTSFTDLVRRLSRKCKTDIHRVRAIFRWITAKDLNKIEFSESLDNDTPMGLLRGIKCGTETYHNVFKRLCSYAGLYCEIIEGYSKGAGYQPGSHFHGQKFRNQWTAVWVDGSWRFINCNWGARHVNRRSDDQPIYQIDEFYFLTDPEEHIYQHFPDDPRWQLLRHPITMETFVLLPVVKSPFFNNHLEFVAKTDAILKTSSGATEVRLITPKNLAVAAKLRSKDGTESSDRKLMDCCIVRMIGNMVIVSAVVRLPGKYYIDIFVGSDWQCESMDSACSLRIHCRSVASAVEHISYPPGICFGATPDFARFGMSEESQHDPLLVASAELKVRFKIAATDQDDIRLSHTLRHWKTGALLDCDRFAVLQTYARGSATWLVRCPKFGLYALSVLAAEGEEEPRCVYRFLIDCQKPVTNARPLPRATPRWRHCRLVEPLDGEMIAKSKVRFRLQSNAAQEIMVNAGGLWTPLAQNGHSWEAVVPTGDVGVEGSAKLVVYGRFDAASDKYIPLLNYIVREQTYTGEVRNLLKYI